MISQATITEMTGVTIEEGLVQLKNQARGRGPKKAQGRRQTLGLESTLQLDGEKALLMNEKEELEQRV